MATTTRILRDTPGTLEHVFEVGEAATDPDGPAATVTVTRADGTAAAAAAAARAGTGDFTYQLAAQPQLHALTVAWTGVFATFAHTETDQAEIVGGFLFSLREARRSDSSLADTSRYPTADLVAARQEVEEECEWICDRAFVPRYRRVVLDGTGNAELVLPDGDIRAVRAVSMATAPGPPVAFTSTQLANSVPSDDGTLRRVDGNVFAEGYDNVVVEYEHGADAPPADLRRAALLRLRTRINISRTGIPDRATSFTVADGGTYQLDLPSAYKTGIPEVDAVYARYSRRTRGDERAPASRSMDFDPQRRSLFHGGQR